MLTVLAVYQEEDDQDPRSEEENLPVRRLMMLCDYLQAAILILIVFRINITSTVVNHTHTHINRIAMIGPVDRHCRSHLHLSIETEAAWH